MIIQADSMCFFQTEIEQLEQSTAARHEAQMKELLASLAALDPSKDANVRLIEHRA